MENYLSALTHNCTSIFGKQLTCLLLLGSVQKKDTTPFSDIDLVGVVDVFCPKKMAAVREYVRGSKKLLDFSIIIRSEIPRDPNKFRIGTHGCYQLELVYKKSRCLHGKNLFLEFPSPNPELLRSSVFEKLAEYTWWLRRIYVEANRPRSFNLNYQINSRLVKMVRDYLYLFEEASIHGSALATVNRLIKTDSLSLSEGEISTLLNLVHPSCINTNAGDMSEEYLKARFLLANKLYEGALKLHHPIESPF